MVKKFALILFVIIIMLFNNGCFNMTIQSDVDFPAGKFKSAWNKIEKLHAKPAHQRGKISQLNLMVYTGDERQFVSFSVPRSLLETILEEGDISDRKDIKKYSGDIGINWDAVKNLDKLKPGLLMEVEVSEDDVHILIWLD